MTLRNEFEKACVGDSGRAPPGERLNDYSKADIEFSDEDLEWFRAHIKDQDARGENVLMTPKLAMCFVDHLAEALRQK
jgi:hypothetical protein